MAFFTICLREPGFFLEYEISESLRDTRLEQNNTIVPTDFCSGQALLSD